MDSWNTHTNYKHITIDIEDDKISYMRRVWELINNAYKISGTGDWTINNIVLNTDYWELVLNGDKVVAAILYDDDGIAVFGHNGYDNGKTHIKQMFRTILNSGKLHEVHELLGRNICRSFGKSEGQGYIFNAKFAGGVIGKIIQPIDNEVFINDNERKMVIGTPKSTIVEGFAKQYYNSSPNLM